MSRKFTYKDISSIFAEGKKRLDKNEQEARLSIHSLEVEAFIVWLSWNKLRNLKIKSGEK